MRRDGFGLFRRANHQERKRRETEYTMAPNEMISTYASIDAWPAIVLLIKSLSLRARLVRRNTLAGHGLRDARDPVSEQPVCLRKRAPTR